MVEPKDASSDSSDEDEAERLRMNAFKSVAVDYATIVDGALEAKKARERGLKRREKAREEGQRSLDAGDDSDGDLDNPKLKPSQIKALDILHRHLDETFGRSFADVDGADGDDAPVPASTSDRKDGAEENKQQPPSGCRLFSRGPTISEVVAQGRGVLESVEQTTSVGLRGNGHEDKGTLLNGRHRERKETKEEKAERKRRLQSVAVDSMSIVEGASQACARLLARLEEEEKAKEERERLERERIQRLKEERGEQWLPSVLVEREVEAAEGAVPRKGPGGPGGRKKRGKDVGVEARVSRVDAANGVNETSDVEKEELEKARREGVLPAKGAGGSGGRKKKRKDAGVEVGLVEEEAKGGVRGKSDAEKEELEKAKRDRKREKRKVIKKKRKMEKKGLLEVG